VTRPSSSIPKLDNPVAQAPLSGRVLTPLVLLGKYVSLLIWPHPMSCDYSYNALPICESPLEPRALWGFACLAGLVTAGFCSYRGRGRALWCVGFFGISYLLVSNTVVLIGTIFAERLMYLPSVAFCWLVAIGAVAAVDWLGERIGGGRRAWFLGALPIVALCALHLSLALARGRVWQSERKLMAAALALTDESARVHTQAGAYGLNDHDPNIAIHHLRRAVEILPDHAIGHSQLGRAYLMAKQPDRAIPHLKRAYGKLAVEANVKPAYYLGQAYMELNTPGLAVPWFELADKYEPNQPSILWAWAQAALGAGNREQAIAVLRRGVQVIPASHQLHDRFRQQLKALMQEDTRPAKPGS
jgi:Tfp pilus assembly protein PilF